MRKRQEEEEEEAVAGRAGREEGQLGCDLNPLSCQRKQDFWKMAGVKRRNLYVMQQVRLRSAPVPSGGGRGRRGEGVV